MPVTPASLRTTFPAFASTSTYPDAMLSMWLTVAALQVNAARWGALADLGAMLYTAHNIALEALVTASAARGSVATGRHGIISSKAADGVSISYDVSSTSEKDAGHWNTTIYGVRYWRMARQMGMGPLQVGADQAPNISASAWAGPPYLP